LMPERVQIRLSTLDRATSLVDEARLANDACDKSSSKMLLWESATEAEYLAFQISTIYRLSDYQPGSTDEPEVSVDVASALLRGAQPSIESDPRSAYGAVRRAVAILRKAHAAVEDARKRQLASAPKNA
jgi:hypothetical protein